MFTHSSEKLASIHAAKLRRVKTAAGKAQAEAIIFGTTIRHRRLAYAALFAALRRLGDNWRISPPPSCKVYGKPRS